jgi:hypothetical protein
VGKWEQEVSGSGGYLAVVLEGADNVETTACDGEHSQHDAEGKDCLQWDEVSLEDGSGDGLERTSHGTGMLAGWICYRCDRQRQPKSIKICGIHLTRQLPILLLKPLRR